MKQLVVIQNNQIVVSSKDIADHFGKQHKDVLENIHNILAIGKFSHQILPRNIIVKIEGKIIKNTL